MFKKLLAFAVTAIVTAGMAAESVDARSLDEILKAGVIRIGVQPNLPPNSVLKPDGSWEGMDIEMGQEIAKVLKVEAEFVAANSPQRVPMIVSDQVDIMLGGLTRNFRRALLIDYTLPTFTESQVVLTTDKWASLQSWRDFDREDITLANVRGSTPAQWTDNNVPKAKKILFDSGADVIRAIGQGRADGTIAVIDNWLRFTKDYSGVTWHVLPDTIYLGYWGIGVQRGNDALRRWLNVWLFDYQSKNKHNAIWEKWYGSAPAFPVVPSPYFN